MANSESDIQPRRLIVSVFLIIIGVVIGVTLVSELHLLPVGRAVGDPPAPPPLIVHAEQTFVEISRAVTPAVVNISSTRVIRREESGSPFNDPFFRRFFGDEFRHPGPSQRKEQGLGSGVIVDAGGLIVTNNHVVAKADEINVILSDKREFKGKVIGTDPKTDLAVVRIEAEGLPTVPWGDSARLEVGEYVLAIGNPFGLNQTVTMGIVSAIGRAHVGIADYEDFIQTDAAINPGNSGGALVNTRGELIGINTAIFSQSGGYMGIGFSVPSNMAKSVLSSLVKGGRVVRGWLGVSIQEVTSQLAKEFGLKEAKGALISDILADSPAEAAGLKRGDIVVALNDQAIENASQLRNQVAQLGIGTRAKVRVIRGGKEKALEIKIEAQPKDVAQAEEKETAENALSGVQVRALTPDLARQLGLGRMTHGVVVVNVEQDSPAEAAGLMRGDLIMEINRSVVEDIDHYNTLLSGADAEAPLLLLVHRQGRALFLTITPKR